MRIKPKPEVVYFDIGDIWPIALALIITVIGISFGLDIQDELKDDFASDECAARTDDFTAYNESANMCQNVSSAANQVRPGSYTFNASEKGEEAVFKLSDKLPTIALVVVAAILIGILVRNLGSNMGKV